MVAFAVEADYATSAQLAGYLRRVPPARHPQVVDLTELSFLDRPMCRPERPTEHGDLCGQPLS
ncbi:hypothetical protein [Nonomuraea sp. NPDC046570]|uniref:hypothetical protein n=1 Tax=Nonomuraea sp. NPDC046570 TaxID=3155255 RepID=UPI0033DA93FE